MLCWFCSSGIQATCSHLLELHISHLGSWREALLGKGIWVPLLFRRNVTFFILPYEVKASNRGSWVQ